MSEILLEAVLTADAGTLIREVRGGKAAVDGLDKAQDGLAGSARRLATATTQSGTATAGAARETRSLAQVAASAAVAEQQLADAQRRVAATSTALATQQARVTAGMGAQRAGAMQLGQQMQDVTIQYGMGTAAGMIFAQQSGQIIGALALMSGGADGAKGKMAALASFMGGPWGIALGVGVSVLGVLATRFLDNADAADKATSAADAFAQRQSNLSNFIDKTTGALAEQNKYLLQNAILLRQAQIDKSRNAILESQNSAFGVADEASRTGRRFVSERAGFATDYDTDVALAISRAGGNQFKLADELKKLEASRTDLAGQIAKVNEAAARSVIEARGIMTAQAEIDFLSGKTATAPGFTAKADKSAKKSDTSAEKARREAAALEKQGESAATAIARMTAEFDRAPKDIDRALLAVRDLDKLITELGEKKPPNFQALINQAQALKPLIAESLARPIREMIDSQERQIALGEAQLRGRQGEGQALQLTYSLMDKMGVESEEQLGLALAQRGIRGDEARQLYDNLGVMREQTRELARQEDRQQAVLDVINAAEQSMTAAIASLRTQGPAAFGDAVKNVMGGLDQMFAQRLTDALFGDLFDDLRDQATGADKVSKAGERIATAVDKAAAEIGKTGAALDALGKAAVGATDRLNGKTPAALPAIASASPAGGPVAESDGSEVTVMGRRVKGGPFAEGYKEITDGLSKSLKGVFNDVFGDRGLFPASLSKSLGQALGGTQIGATFGSSISKALGLGGSSTGGALGGAIGQSAATAFLGASAGPLGALAGGLLGSVVGGLFKSTKYASASFSTSGGTIEQTSNGGNTAQYDKQLGVLGDSFMGGLRSIAEQLGGSVTGPISTSIGLRKGEIRVDVSGTGKTKGGTVTDFYDDAEGAIKFAIQDALGDGAVQGLSSAVAKALRSSSDLDSAIAEALKVREIEQLLAGTGSALEKELRTFESQAKERVRIATQYGFDVIRIEQSNAKERQAIIDDFVSGRVGSLQDMLKDLRFGDLAEGSLAEQRTRLLSEIATARGKAMDGEDGAADTLADLTRRLIDISRDAYGTAGGEYASDRASAISNAEAVIKAENDRAKAAQDAALATNAKLDTANALADEANDYLSRIASQMAALGYAGIATGGSGGGVNVGRAVTL